MIALAIISTPEYMDIPPLSLLYVGGALRKAGYEVEVFHCQSDQIEACAKRIVKRDPLFLGISVFTGNQTKFSAQLSREVRKRSDIPIVWGGIHPSLVPGQTLGEDYIDCIIIGEGEEAIVELARAIEKKRSFRDIRGIGYKRNGKPHFTGQRPLIRNLDDYRLDWDLVDVRKYYLSLWDCKRVLKFITSRGCPYNCTFCYNQRFNRGIWRAHSIDFIVSEIQRLKGEYNIDGVGFYDDNFFSNPKRAIEILTRIDLPWGVLTYIKEINRERMEKFRRIHCREMVFGFESGSDRILKLINKRFTVKDIIDGVRLLSDYKDIRVAGSFIIGLPTETWEEIGNTIRLFLKLADIHPKIGYTIGMYLPFPGTDLYELAVKSGFRPPKRTEDWYLLDRWKNIIDPVWMGGRDSEKKARYFYLIRKYSQLVAMKHLHMPIISRIPHWRLSNRNFTFPIEQPFLSWLQQSYAHKSSFISRVMHKFVRLYTLNKYAKN